MRQYLVYLGTAFAALAILIVSWAGCEESTAVSPVSTDSDADSDADADSGSDSDTDSDSDGDSDSDTDGDSDGEIHSYLWVANSGESTLSKVDTQAAVEIARYKTCPLDHCDPSRTSVNLYGDVVVTNRSPSTGESSVTKFAANRKDCKDRNNNGTIDTSSNPDDVKPWGEDECMLWNTFLDVDIGARATAWDGTEDQDTGEGGHALIGTCIELDTLTAENKVYVLNGDDGSISDQISVSFQSECAYGGAMDGSDGFWIMEGYGYPHKLVKVDMSNSAVTSFPLMCGYGISVDSKGRVWTGGKKMGTDSDNCVARYDPAIDSAELVDVAEAEWLRGIAVGVEKSAGYVWSSDTNGTLYKIDQETLTLVDSYSIGAYNMVGVAVDFEGYVWTVSQDGDATYKFDPDTNAAETVPIGDSPYTYSDMTGIQLRQAVVVK